MQGKAHGPAAFIAHGKPLLGTGKPPRPVDIPFDLDGLPAEEEGEEWTGKDAGPSILEIKEEVPHHPPVPKIEYSPSGIRFCKNPTWWQPGLGYSNTDIARPEQVKCEVAGNRFDSYAAVTKDGKDVICARVTKVLEEGIGFGQAFVDWAVNQTVGALQEALQPWQDYSPRQIMEMLEAAKQARFKTAQEAAEYGTRVHELIELWITHGVGHGPGRVYPALSELTYEQDGKWWRVDLTEEAEPVRNAMQAFLSWWAAEGLVPVATEQWLVDIELGFGGTLDCVCRDKHGQLVMCDWKTSKAIRDKYLLQVAAYDILWDSAKHYSSNPIYQEPISRAYIVRVDKATAQTEIYPVFRDSAERQAVRNQWYATLQTFRWLKDVNKDLAKRAKASKR